MEARNRTLSDWLTRVRTRQIVLPRFQRHEAWTPKQIGGLLDNVLMSLPCGALLTLDRGDEDSFDWRTVVGAPTEGDRVTEYLLDGQQRVTALWRTLHDDYEDSSWFVQLEDPEDDESEPYSVCQKRHVRDGKRYPLWLDRPEELWYEGLVPVRLLRPDAAAGSAVYEWAMEASGGDAAEEREIVRAVHELREPFARYSIPYLVLPSSTTPATALDVFVKMNTSSTPLSPFDVVVALVEATTGESLHAFVEELVHEVPHVSCYSEPEELLLATAALLADRPASRSTYLSRGFSSGLARDRLRIIRGVRRAVAFLEEEKLFDATRLPSDVVVPVLAACWADVPEGGDAEGRTREQLGRYLWRAFCTDRYERSTTTRAHADHRRLRDLVRDPAAPVPDLFDDSLHRLPSLEELLHAGWPKRRDRLARAILVVSLRHGGRDFADGGPASRAGLAGREYHHLFPRAWLERQGRDKAEIDRALNCVLVSWRTNRTISDKSPARYLEERLAGSSTSEIGSRLQSHLVPYGALLEEDYDLFLGARAELVLEDMRRLCGGVELGTAKAA